MEDSEYFGKSDVEKAEIFAENLLAFAGVKAVCLSVYVWNRQVLEKVGKILKSKDILVIAGGPEITANSPFSISKVAPFTASTSNLPKG